MVADWNVDTRQSVIEGGGGPFSYVLQGGFASDPPQSPDALCPSGTYQAAELVYDCGGGSGTKDLDLAEGASVYIAIIPKGAVNLRIGLEAGADLDIRVTDPQASSGCVAGYSCTIAGSPPDGSSGTYEGMTIKFSGDMVTPDAVTGLVTESL